MTTKDTTEFYEVFSVCNKPDAPTWAIAAPQILKLISAQNYRVIVPDNEVDFFKSISPPGYIVSPETNYIKNWQALLAQHAPPLFGNSYGWYLQQFLKLAAAASAPPDEYILIWDADTVPLKPLHFRTEDDKINYYTGVENHRPYFSSIERMLGLKKRVNFSFIAQCFPVKCIWVREMFDKIERLHGTSWQSALIKSMDMRTHSQFSEYETLGTFLTHHHDHEIAFAQNKWARLGRSLITKPENLEAAKFKSKLAAFDFISFEKWDIPQTSFASQVKTKFRNFFTSKL